MASQLKLWVKGKYWVQTSRDDGFARELADRHYSRQTIGARDFIAPGEALVLVGDDRLWVIRKAKYRRDNLKGLECSIFRNESDILSSELIKEAVNLTFDYFREDKEIFTYIDPKKIKSNNPGCCFTKIGFVKSGYSKNGKVLLKYKKNERFDNL